MTAPKISKFWQDPGFYLSLLFILTVVVEIVISLDFPYRAKLFPLIVGSFCLVLISLDLLGRIFPAVAGRLNQLRGGQMLDTGKMEAERSCGTNPEKEADARFDHFGFLKIFLWFSGYFLLLRYVGYLFSILIFLFLFLKFFSKCRWLTSVQVTAGVAMAAWAIFSLILDIPWFGALE